MRLFVTGFHPNFQNEDLQEIFEPYGEVSSARIIFDRDTGNSRCFGFVEMTNDSEANKAIDKLDGKTPDGFKYPISVTEARAKPS